VSDPLRPLDALRLMPVVQRLLSVMATTATHAFGQTAVARARPALGQRSQDVRRLIAASPMVGRQEKAL
jgi:hypothetical protein